MTSLLKALTGFALVFVGALVPVSQMTQHLGAPAQKSLRTAIAAGHFSDGAAFKIRPDLGCIARCEPPPDPVLPVADPPPADAAPPAPALAAVPRSAAPRPPAVVVGSTQQALINSDRAAAGLPPLTWSSCLAGVAASWASYMARTGVFQHGPGVSQDFGCGLGSRQCGENIAWMTGGPNDAKANSMFMNSPEHRANILGPYRYVGTAWATANGKSYIVEEFG
jgi:hypothetical protein